MCFWQLHFPLLILLSLLKARKRTNSGKKCASGNFTFLYLYSYLSFTGQRMASWFSLVARVLRTDPLENSALMSARCEFEEGDLGQRPGTGMIRHVDISFWGDTLNSGRSYFILGSIRLADMFSLPQHNILFVRCIHTPRYYSYPFDQHLLLA
jgi:hypothetical protein